MVPGADEEGGLAPGGAQGLVILQLPLQKEVVPAGHESDGSRHLMDPGAEIYRLPVRVLGSMDKEVLVNRRVPSDGGHVGVFEWQMHVGLLEPPSPLPLAEE